MPWVVALTIASLLAVIVSIGFGVRETKRRKELEAKLALLLSQNAKDQLTDRLTGL